MQPTPKLILPTEYVADAIKSIRLAKNRICVLTLVLVEDDATMLLIEELRLAAERGVKVSIGADAFTYTELRGSFIPTTHRSKRYLNASNLKKRLEKAGAHFTWLGRLSTIFVSGRTHVKWCIVDDIVYSFGGVNLDSESFTYTDYMFRVQNEALADRLNAEHERIIRADKSGHAYRSLRFGDDDNMVLIDGGFLGDSIIYRRACKLAEQAEKIVYVSQYHPAGRLARILKKKGADLYFNQHSNSGTLNALIISFGIKIMGNVSKYERSAYLHSKFMIFTMKDGSKVAITGSHNFAGAGVILGTREVALETSNKKIIRQLERFFKDYVK